MVRLLVAWFRKTFTQRSPSGIPNLAVRLPRIREDKPSENDGRRVTYMWQRPNGFLEESLTFVLDSAWRLQVLEYYFAQDAMYLGAKGPRAGPELRSEEADI